MTRLGCLWLALACTASAADVRLPNYTRRQLPNGAVLYLIPHSGAPLVSFRVIVKGGFESVPAAQAGLADITATLLRKGCAGRTADQFSQELDGLGGVFRTSTDEQATVVGSEFLKKDFAQGLALTADAVLHPTFPEAEVGKVVAQAVDSAKTLKDNPQAAITQYFRAFFYGPGHPYGRPEDERSLAGLKRADIAGYHQRMYAGPNLIVIVSGEFDNAAAADQAANVFGTAPKGPAYRWAESVAPAAGARLLLIDKPDATQTYFEIGQRGIARTDPDRTAVLLINTLFGGRFTSMLNDELRVNSGLTYGASSIVHQYRMAGDIAISTYTRTATTAQAMDKALELLKRINDKGVTAEQLASAKAYVKGTYPTRYLETSDQLASVIGDMDLFGLNRGEVDDLFSRIDSVTLERANAAIRKHYGSGQLTFVVLGNAKEIRGAVKKYAPEMVEVSVAAPGFGL